MGFPGLIMTQKKREQVSTHLRFLRQEMREIFIGVQKDGLSPEQGELRGILAQMESLLELLEENTKVQSSSDLI